MKVIYKAEEGQLKALVRGRNMHGEYEVDFYVDGVVCPGATYYTDDRVDAEGTADAWVDGSKIGPVMVGAIVDGKVRVAVVGAAEAAAFVGGA